MKLIEIIIITLLILVIIFLIVYIIRTRKEKTLNEKYSLKNLEIILDTIGQAILLFDNKDKLLFFNKDAKKLLDLNDNDYQRKAKTIFNNTEIREAIKSRENIESFDIYEDNKVYAINTFILDIKKDRSSIIVTIQNVTENRKVEQTKKDFFSHASHELKSPLTSIIGYSELATLNMIDKNEYEDIFKRIYSQASHMTLLVEEMQALSKLELTSSDETYPLVSLNQILKNVIESLLPLITSKNIEIKLESNEISYQALEMDIFKLFKNLIENAIKYSKDNSLVEVDLYEEPSKIIFLVKDYGAGISPKHQQRIFERFYRVEKSRIISGSGLGLAIVKHILIKYKGEIKVESTVDVGTKMTVILKK